MVKYVTILSQLHGWLNPFLEISLNMYNLDVNYEEKFAIFRANTLRDSDSNPGLALNSFPSQRFLIYYSDTKNKIIQTRCGIISFYL